MLYRTLVVDPPWPLARIRRAIRPNDPDTLDYPTMPLPEIHAFPIRDWAAPDSFLFLWTTNAFVEESFSILRDWGFKYHCLLTWCKNSGICPWSPFQFRSEYLLFATRGSCLRTVPLGKLKTWFQAPSGRHSEKPAEFYSMIATYFPEPRIDIFARRRHPGYDAWGNEVEAPDAR